jgi:hypothetical protein
VNELRGQVVKCIKDQNGNHVIQKIIEKVSPRDLQFIIDAVLGTASGQTGCEAGCQVCEQFILVF